MALALPNNPSFEGYLQFAWDNTSVSVLKECPRKYQYAILQGYQSKTKSVHLIFGLLYHAGLEYYDHMKAKGQSHSEALRLTVRFILEKTWNKTLNRPWDTQDSYKNRATLLRTVVWYLEQFEHDPLETVLLHNGKPAVELSFRVEISHQTPTGEPYLYCGHIDRLVKFAGNNYIVDRKTTKSMLGPWFFSTFTPNSQFSGYVFGGNIALGLPITGLIVDAAQVAVSFSDFQRSPIQRSPVDIAEWYKDLGYWLKQAELYAEDQYWPKQEGSCGNYGGCEFRETCSMGESMRQGWLKSNFTQRVWNPLETRGDI